MPKTYLPKKPIKVAHSLTGSKYATPYHSPEARQAERDRRDAEQSAKARAAIDAEAKPQRP